MLLGWDLLLSLCMGANPGLSGWGGCMKGGDGVRWCGDLCEVRTAGCWGVGVGMVFSQVRMRMLLGSGTLVPRLGVDSGA